MRRQSSRPPLSFRVTAASLARQLAGPAFTENRIERLSESTARTRDSASRICAVGCSSEELVIGSFVVIFFRLYLVRIEFVEAADNVLCQRQPFCRYQYQYDQHHHCFEYKSSSDNR